MNGTPLPTPQQVREMLEMLLGRDVQVTTGADMVSLAAETGATVGVFVTDPGKRLAALWVSDLPLSARMGAAMGLLPPAVGNEGVELGMTPALNENLREAINVAGSMLNAEDAPHIILEEVYPPKETLPRDVVGLVQAYVPRYDLKVEIAGYGAGVLSIVVP